MVTPKPKRPHAAIQRPRKVPNNLRLVPWVALPVIALQIAYLTWPAKVATSTTSSRPVAIPSLLQTKLVVLQNGIPIKSGDQVVPGEDLEYRLVTTNPTNSAVSVMVGLPFSDVTQYANISDINGATINNGTASWPTELIPAQHTSTHQLFVEVHNLPSDQATNGANYDTKLSATYGNVVELNLQPSFAKRVEAYVRKLPTTTSFLGLAINLLILVWWVKLLDIAKNHRQISKNTGTLLITWFLGSGIVLLVTGASAYHSGFALTGSETIIGGLIGLLFGLVAVLYI